MSVELSQDVASKGLGLVYELGGEQDQQELVSILVGTLMTVKGIKNSLFLVPFIIITFGLWFVVNCITKTCQAPEHRAGTLYRLLIRLSSVSELLFFNELHHRISWALENIAMCIFCS